MTTRAGSRRGTTGHSARISHKPVVKAPAVTPVVQPKPKYVYDISIGSMGVVTTQYDTDCIWQSLAFDIEGNIKKLALTVYGEFPDETNISFEASIEGFPWVPVVPRNRTNITGEKLSLDYTNTAMLFYPAVSSPGPTFTGIDSTVSISQISSDPVSGSGDCVGVTLGKKPTMDVTTSYTTSYSGLVDLDSIGIASGAARIVDSVTDGELGEHYNNINSTQINLNHYPHSGIKIYCNGVLATQVGEDVSLNDQSLPTKTPVYKIVGKTLFLRAVASQISAYYQYSLTSIRLRALLTTTYQNNEKTPSLDGIAIGIKTAKA